MNLENLFNECADKEMNKRKREQELNAKRIALRYQWCANAMEKLSFLLERGFRMKVYQGLEFPYVLINAPQGFAFAHLESEHVYEEEDLNANAFYARSNMPYIFPLKSKITWEQFVKELVKWI